MKRLFLLALLSAIPFASHATVYIQNQTDLPMDIQYQYYSGQTPGPMGTANNIAPHTAYAVPTAPGPNQYNLVHIRFATTTDGWSYNANDDITASPYNTCDSLIYKTPTFTTLSKSYVTNLLQCIRG